MSIVRCPANVQNIFRREFTCDRAVECHPVYFPLPVKDVYKMDLIKKEIQKI